MFREQLYIIYISRPVDHGDIIVQSHRSVPIEYVELMMWLQSHFITWRPGDVKVNFIPGHISIMVALKRPGCNCKTL